ncbi:24-hydroxycholesterol 7-alpha-hydroxylase [Thomomys bottae]
MELVCGAAALALGGAALGLALRRRRRRRPRPPCVRGWLPWVGAAAALGRAPLAFVERARAQCGPVFTVFALGIRMTFVTEEEGINVFLNSKNINFELAVQKPVYRTASIPKNIFFTLHEKLYILMKGKLGIFNIHQFTGKLMEELHEQFENLGSHGTMELSNLVRTLLYPTTVNILFNKGLIPTNKGELHEFYHHFETYDDGFEYGSHMPEWLLRNWSKSKKWLLAIMEKNITHMKAYKSEKDSSVMQAILDSVEMEKSGRSPNYGLLMLWASLSNAVPIAFWTLAFVLSHPDIHRAIKEDMASVFGSSGKDKMKVTEDELKKLPLVKFCVLEAIRLRAPGVIARKVVKPVKIMNFTVPCGDLLVASPFWLHRNPKYFPEPELFKPERWKKANLEKHVFLDGFLAFGGGKFQCPGRWFSLLEIEIFIILMLYKYDCCLLDPVPKQSDHHLVGVPKPEGQCRIEYKKKDMTSLGPRGPGLPLEQCHPTL